MRCVCLFSIVHSFHRRDIFATAHFCGAWMPVPGIFWHSTFRPEHPRRSLYLLFQPSPIRRGRHLPAYLRLRWHITSSGRSPYALRTVPSSDGTNGVIRRSTVLFDACGIVLYMLGRAVPCRPVVGRFFPTLPPTGVAEGLLRYNSGCPLAGAFVAGFALCGKDGRSDRGAAGVGGDCGRLKVKRLPGFMGMRCSLRRRSLPCCCACWALLCHTTYHAGGRGTVFILCFVGGRRCGILSSLLYSAFFFAGGTV